ncbi:MAG: sigma-54-dependent Fis family transcriptional regulator [Chloroflexi bacterium]|nr:sigma-54-dependent Fis family transcriptional regulator [Chloroflexota bacterium]
MTSPRILVIEDDTRSAQSLERLLKSQGYTVTLCHRGDEGFERASGEDFDVVITDFRLPGVGGLDVIRQLHAKKPRLPMVLMTAFGTTETAIEATKHGAFEYVLKPFDVAEMLEVVKRAAASARLMNERVELGEDKSAGEAIVGHSRAMQAVYKEIGQVAATPATVLIRGETGTGKELVARALYQHSDRGSKPFIAINCAAIPETLLESELFGHERGAFTGADQRRIGRFEQAHGGTLFLDEIGDLSAFTQAKLLRVLQDKLIQRVGGKEDIPVDARIIAATHCDLESAIVEKQFREDLYYRLSAVVIKLPPLRDRAEDIPALAGYFLHRFRRELKLADSSLQPEAVAWLQQQRWPGNVRELANVLRQGLLASRGFPISQETLAGIAAKSSDTSFLVRDAGVSLEALMDDLLAQARSGADLDVHAKVFAAMERELFTRAIQLAHGNQAQAARWLKMSRQTVREKLRHFGLKAASEDAES